MNQWISIRSVVNSTNTALKENEIYIPSSVSQIDLIKKINSSGKFQHDLKKDIIVFKSLKKFGNRGVLRLLLPRADVHVQIENRVLRYNVVNDFWAKWMLVVATAGMVVELLMDREKFPREYPVEFICALFVYFWAMTFYEKSKTKRIFEETVKSALNA